MPFKMKGSPLKAIGDKKTGTVRVEGVTKRITYQDPPSSSKTNTIGSMQGPASQPLFSPTPTAGNNLAKEKPKKVKSSGNSFQKAASKLGVKDYSNEKISVSSKPAKLDNAIKTASASKLSSDLTKKTAAKSTKATKTTETPKSRKEIRLAKTKKKAAAVKSDYNAGSRGQAEGRAAKAKHNRLNKRAERIENRIAKKNKK